MGCVFDEKSHRRGLLSIIFLLLCGSCYLQDTIRIPIGGRWKLECPKVEYRNERDSVTVTWLHNNAIWMKIENSNATIAPLLNTIQRSKIDSAIILNIISNNERYKFYYDEMVTDYSLTITNAALEDTGLWLCDVALQRLNGAMEEFQHDAYLLVGNAVSDIGDKDNANPDAYDDFEGDSRSKSKPDKTSRLLQKSVGLSSNYTGNSTASTFTYSNQQLFIPIIFLVSMTSILTGIC